MPVTRVKFSSSFSFRFCAPIHQQRRLRVRSEFPKPQRINWGASGKLDKMAANSPGASSSLCKTLYTRVCSCFVRCAQCQSKCDDISLKKSVALSSFHNQVQFIFFSVRFYNRMKTVFFSLTSSTIESRVWNWKLRNAPGQCIVWMKSLTVGFSPLSEEKSAELN